MDIYFDHDAEMEFIGQILSGSREAADRIPEITGDDFTLPECRAFYAEIQLLHSQGTPIDVPTCVGKVFQTGSLKLDLGAISSIGVKFLQYAVSTITLGSTIRRLKEFTRRRLLKQICSSITERIGLDETDDLIDNARTMLRDAVQANASWSDTTTLVTEFWNYMDDVGSGRISPIKTGLKTLDIISGGLWPGELIILAGRTGGGKSALSQFIATNAAKNGKKVLFVSREMSSLQYTIRSAAAQSGLDSSRIRRGTISEKEYEQLGDATARIQQLPIYFTFNTRTIEDLRTEVQHRMDTTGADLVIVDYLQIMSTRQSFSSEYQRISYISRCLKEITLDFKVPVLALSQVSRGTGLLSLNSLRDSGCIEQDADSVWLINTPNEQDHDWLSKDQYQWRKTLEDKQKRFVVLEVAKSRMGSISSAWLSFDPAHMYYTTLE